MHRKRATIPTVGWLRVCAVVGCREKAARTVVWKAATAGESLLCERHFREYRRKFAYLLSTKAQPKPSERFSDTPVGPEAQEHSQLEM